MQIFDTMDAHLAQGADMEGAVLPLGLMLAWCIRLNLVAENIRRDQPVLVTRVQMQDIAPAEIGSALGGVLSAEHVNRQGREFLEHNYARYLQLLADVSGGSMYSLANDWHTYDTVAPTLTAWLRQRQSKGTSGKFGLRRLWEKLSGWDEQ